MVNSLKKNIYNKQFSWIKSDGITGLKGFITFSDKKTFSDN